MRMTLIKCPNCGKSLVIKEGLEGLWCPDPKCGYYDPSDPSSEDILATGNAKEIFSEDRVKHLRGVPMDIFTIGSEAKGRIQIQIPCGCTKAERRFLINNAIDDLEYLKNTIDEKHLDIYSSRGKKE